MSQPLVCCLLLTSDRLEMTARAVRSYDQQEYENRCLFIFDTGREQFGPRACTGVPQVYIRHERARGVWLPEVGNRTVGELRNRAIAHALGAMPQRPDLIAHWDSDDWSHPRRLTEQVDLLEAYGSEIDAVGYKDMLFWYDDGDQAWLYKSTSEYLLGTSLLYRLRSWQSKAFELINEGEDRRWLRGLQSRGISSSKIAHAFTWPLAKPRMIASIHTGNTASRIDAASENWKRAPEWDEYCRQTMALERSPDPAPPAQLASPTKSQT